MHPFPTHLDPDLILVISSKYHDDRHHRVARPRSRDRMTSLLQSDSICALESVTHALIRLLTQTTRGHHHAQINLSSQLWVLFLMLLVSMSPNSCSAGACTNSNPHVSASVRACVLCDQSVTNQAKKFCICMTKSQAERLIRGRLIGLRRQMATRLFECLCACVCLLTQTLNPTLILLNPLSQP